MEIIGVILLNTREQEGGPWRWLSIFHHLLVAAKYGYIIKQSRKFEEKKCYSDYISKHTVKPYHSIPVKSLKLSAINFMANRWGKSGNSDRFYFLGLQSHHGR